ncbi:MAG: leucine--tRNA ligase [Nitrososphaerota archaeon]|nr:leucine--tRNA ligase [Nitrososphaerota archaeon]MDG6977634.1 leucine--tRNA ligase [Nitrososphaerota archaeon]MDG7022379.1 leucine--tRNA ligase [Nitrososphaerota archaeon]
MASYERYWLKVWNERRVFESEAVPNKKKAFVTFPFPYMNGPLHIGHCFTATRVDIYARFKRMQGYNVLFPWAWHWTGESIPGMSYRLSQGDEGVKRAFMEIDGVPESEVERFVDPEYLASYYTRVSREAVKDTGFSIDWRREFRTVDPAFKKFIDWQYQRLRELGYVVQGTHPVVWCPHDQSPTGDHDRMEGEGVSPEEFDLLRFEVDEPAAKDQPTVMRKFLVAGTLRPETIFGATNVWVHPHGRYAVADVDGETWIVSLSAVQRLSEQQRRVKVLNELEGSELLGLTVRAPITGKDLPVLPGTFVDTELVTGVVYSVPAHAPYDYMALVDVQEGRVKAAPAVRALALALKPIPIISVQGYSAVPAEDEVKRRGINGSDDPRLEEATAELYKAEFHRGVMKENTGPYRGAKVSEAKDKVIADMKAEGILSVMGELPQKVVCKCATRCYVKILENQWFLNYSDPAWKERTKDLIRAASVFPEQSLEWYFSTIDWLRNWPCARKSGMGTRLPWDKDWIVETLSDSTIYMAFYTISQYVNSETVRFDQLLPEVFDYVLLGRGSEAHVSKLSGIELRHLKAMRSSFLYWYPVDLRNSAKELIPNHLTFFAFQHAALFEPKHWPRGFSVNGMIQIEGQKMSKSRNVFVTWRRALDQYGADGLRATLALAADGMDDADWKAKNAEDISSKIGSLFSFVEKNLAGAAERPADLSDRWLLSVLHRRVEAVTSSLEEMKIRKAISVGLLDVWNDIRWYLRRTGEPRYDTLRTAFETWIRLIAPFTPFASEELNKRLGNKGLIATADWPSAVDLPIDESAELSELLVTKVIEDARNLLRIIKERKGRLTIYAASDQASSYFLELAKAERGEGNRGAVIRKHASSGIRPERVIKLQHELGGELVSRLAALGSLDEHAVLSGAAPFLSGEVGIDVRVFKAGAKGTEDPANKAKDALPFKPSFYLE